MCKKCFLMRTSKHLCIELAIAVVCTVHCATSLATSKIIKSYALMLTKEHFTALQNSFDGVRVCVWVCCAHFCVVLTKSSFARCFRFLYAVCCCCFLLSYSHVSRSTWTYSRSVNFFAVVVVRETCSRARFIHARYAILQYTLRAITSSTFL